MNEYQQNDMGICAFLMTKGFKVLGLVPAGRGLDFRFADDGTAEQAALEYLQGEPTPARAFYDALKTLKTMLYRTKTFTGQGPNGDRHHARSNSH